jgi:hypothetical protein
MYVRRLVADGYSIFRRSLELLMSSTHYSTSDGMPVPINSEGMSSTPLDPGCGLQKCDSVSGNR